MIRSRRNWLVNLIGTLAVSISLTGCDIATPTATPTLISAIPTAAPQSCVPSAPTKPTVSVDDHFNTLFSSHPNGWMGADGAYSVQMPDGSIAWLFGDTILGKPQADGSFKPAAFVNNSLIVQAGDNLTARHGGSDDKATAMITPTDPTTWYWPAGGVIEGDNLRVFLLHLRRAGNGTPGFDFTSIGHDIATMSLPDLKVQTITAVPFESKVDYGGSFVAAGNYTYIYGLEDLGSAKYGHVARVLHGQLTTARWEFYDGTGWSSNPLSTTRIISDVSNLSVLQWGNGYVLVGMEADPSFGKNILAYYACSPVGPWTDRTVLYTVPEASGSVITYLAIAHPEFSAGGALLISYCLNDTRPQNGVTNTNIYRPHFIRVNFAGAP